jgi:roadblock/LC7 domain-containing protein
VAYDKTNERKGGATTMAIKWRKGSNLAQQPLQAPTLLASIAGAVAAQELLEECKELLTSGELSESQLAELLAGLPAFEQLMQTVEAVDWTEFFTEHGEAVEIVASTVGSGAASWLARVFWEALIP